MRTRIDAAFEKEAGEAQTEMLQEFNYLNNEILPPLRKRVAEFWALIAKAEGETLTAKHIELTNRSARYHEEFMSIRDEWFRVLRRLQKLGRFLNLTPTLSEFDLKRGNLDGRDTDRKQDQRLDSSARKHSTNRRRRLSTKRRS